MILLSGLVLFARCPGAEQTLRPIVRALGAMLIPSRVDTALGSQCSSLGGPSGFPCGCPLILLGDSLSFTDLDASASGPLLGNIDSGGVTPSTVVVMRLIGGVVGRETSGACSLDLTSRKTSCDMPILSTRLLADFSSLGQSLSAGFVARAQ